MNEQIWISPQGVLRELAIGVAVPESAGKAR